MSGQCPCGCGKQTGALMYASRRCMKRVHGLKRRGLEPFPMTERMCKCGCGEKFKTQDRRRVYACKACVLRAVRDRANPSRRKYDRKTESRGLPLPFIDTVSRLPWQSDRLDAASKARQINAEMETERKQCQADIIARHSIKLNPTRDIPPDPSPAIKLTPARTWQNFPDRSAKTGRCAKHDKTCFDIRTRTALRKR